jgi:hypothetical protein
VDVVEAALKGRTTQPLVIDVIAEWIVKQPAVKWLQSVGHVIQGYGQENRYPPDWIMHPAAGWHEQFFYRDEKGAYPFVEARLKAERARKKAGR